MKAKVTPKQLYVKPAKPGDVRPKRGTERRVAFPTLKPTESLTPAPPSVAATREAMFNKIAAAFPSDMREGLLALASSVVQCRFDGPQPRQWISEATKRLAREVFTELAAPDFSENYKLGWVCGWWDGLVEGYRRELQDEPDVLARATPVYDQINPVFHAMRIAAAELPIPTAFEFYSGARAGLVRAQKLPVLSSSQKCLFDLVFWPGRYDGMSRQRIHEMFKSKKFIVESVDSSWTRALLRQIKFSPGEPGRPKKRISD